MFPRLCFSFFLCHFFLKSLWPLPNFLWKKFLAPNSKLMIFLFWSFLFYHPTCLTFDVGLVVLLLTYIGLQVLWQILLWLTFNARRHGEQNWRRPRPSFLMKFNSVINANCNFFYHRPSDCSQTQMNWSKMILWVLSLKWLMILNDVFKDHTSLVGKFYKIIGLSNSFLAHTKHLRKLWRA